MSDTPPPATALLDGEPLDANGRRRLSRNLRQLGYSYGEIAVEVGVPKSTVATWCRGVRLNADQRAAIDLRTGPASRRGTSVDTQWKRRAEIQRIRSEAAHYAVGAIDDPLFVAGVCLYWAEGSKTRNDLSITNSDPRVLRVFVEFVRAHLDPLATFALALNIHDVAGDEAARRFWASSLRLEDARFTKSYVKTPGTGHRRKRLPHGVCRVRVDRASDHWHRVMTWIDAVGHTLGD